MDGEVVYVKPEPLGYDEQQLQDPSEDPLCDDANAEEQTAKQMTLPEADDVICQLMERPLATRPLSEQKEIVRRGRPPLSAQFSHADKKSGKPFSRHLTHSIYSSYKWVTLSEARRKIFCWPCVLFPARHSLWNRDGYFDLKNMSRSASQHAKTKHHIVSCIALSRFKKRNVPEEPIRKTPSPATDVAENREAFRRVVDAVLLRVREDLPSDNPEPFDHLFRHNSPLRRIWCELNRDKNAFNRLIQGVYETLALMIKKNNQHELNQASCFSAIVDHQTGDRCSIIGRYVEVKTAQVAERLLDLLPTPDKTADNLFRCMDSLLRQFFYRSKMVAHCYSGGCLAVGEVAAMRARVEASVPESLYVTSSYHRLCDSVADAACTIAETVPFFCVLRLFPKFINEVLKETTNESLAIDLKADSDLKSTVNFVYDNREGIISFLKGSTDLDATNTCRSYLCSMAFKEPTFLCLLVTYIEIFERMGDLVLCDDKMSRIPYRNTVNDVQSVQAACSEAVARLKALLQPDGLVGFLNTVSEFGFNASNGQLLLYKSCVNNVLLHLKSRYDPKKVVAPLLLFQLVDPLKFDGYTTLFPKPAFDQLTNTYGKLLDVPQLKGELEVVYNDPDFRRGSVDEIHRAIRDNRLEDVLTETCKLLTIVRTIPPTTGSITPSTTSRSPLQQRIARFAESGLPTSHALAYVHKHLLIEMEKSLDWYEDVMEIFSQTEYKNCVQLFQ